MDIKDIGGEIAKNVSKEDAQAIANKAVDSVKREVNDVKNGQNIKDSAKDVVKDVADAASDKVKGLFGK
ncbi:MAG: hypothetical protein K6F92_04925 [Lachnospiraceae bacterium]|nr:hypothetical protein [Lachnospiraceae bacterium]